MKTLAPKQSPVKLLTEEFWSKNEILNQPAKIEHSVNIIDKNGNYKIQVNAPGFKKEDFKIRVENGVLKIQAYTTDNKEEIKKNYVRKEFLTSSLARNFRLPEGIDVSNIKARYKNGRLYIKMGKANTVKQTNKKVEEALKRSAVDEREITVSVSGTTVTLTGTVHSWQQKEEAGRIAWKTPGIKHLKNKLEVDYEYNL